MRKTIKQWGQAFLKIFNINIRRKLNGKKLVIPLRCGVKVGISGEKWMSGLLKKLFQLTDGAFLDVGVNLGQTLIKVKTLDPDRDYIGIEPNPSCIFYLTHLLRLNAWQNVQIVPVGIYTQECLLNLSGRNETDGSSTLVDEFKQAGAFSQLVPLFSFNTIQQNIPDKTFSFIKIDVEGAELEVFDNLADIISSQRPIVIIEVWNNNGDPVKISKTESLNKIISRLNYTVYSWSIPEDRTVCIDFRRAKLGEHPDIDNYLLLPEESCKTITDLLNNRID